MFWTALSMGALAVAELVALLVLARLLSPNEFGLYSAALIVIKFSAIFQGLGITPAIVQRPVLEERHLRVGFTLSLLLGLAVAALVWGLLAERFGVAAEVYSAPSFPLLRRDALEAERWNRLNPDAKTPRVPHVATMLPFEGGPIVAATDWMKALPDMVSRWLPPHYVALGTDGFGRSDTRESLRALFEIDPPHIAAATMVALARCGALPASKAAKAVRDLGIDPNKTDPLAL
jgi:pyruvate dehydrogenase complex dehydrogenase (E1) component